jgi:hypothetical protein
MKRLHPLVAVVAASAVTIRCTETHVRTERLTSRCRELHGRLAEYEL